LALRLRDGVLRHALDATHEGSLHIYRKTGTSEDDRHSRQSQQSTGVAEARDVEARATALGLSAKLISAGGPGDIEPAFAAAPQENIQAVFICNDPFLIDLRHRLVRIVTERALPAVYFSREFVEAGGVLSYGASITDGYKKVGVYVGRILMGARPADLPVQQPTEFELVSRFQSTNHIVALETA
jgi:ABC-type uncharacterized transport system substrate-binding protein